MKLPRMGELFKYGHVRQYLGDPPVNFEDLSIRDTEVEQQANGYDISC